jgi:carboxymethylenebutenolidase
MDAAPRPGLGSVLMSESLPVTAGWLDVEVPAGRGTPASSMRAWLARPQQSGTWPAVLIGFEMFGITGFLRDVAGRFAAAGYLALVPDYYHWQSAAGEPVDLAADEAGRSRGLELINGLDRAQVRADAAACAAALAARPESSGRLAVFGMSAGGHISFYAGTQLPLDALVLLYPGWLATAGTGLSQPGPLLGLAGELAGQGTPLLMLAGADDHLYGPGELGQIEAALAAAGVQHELVVYPATPHGFFCPERDTYRPAQAADAWARTMRLLAGKCA